MDTKGKFEEHTMFKLDLYKAYLEGYLAVLLNAAFYDKINIFDLFAGIGKSSDGCKGSALISAIEIEKARKNYPRKKLSLILNEKKKKHFSALSENLKNFKDFTLIHNEDADDFISGWSPSMGSHNLFFIDPHGYTEISTHNLRHLFTQPRSDFLIFVPIYHIYRFLRAADAKEIENVTQDFFDELGLPNEERSKEDAKAYFEPISKFLSGLGVDHEAAVQCENVKEFAELVVAAFKKISESKYVYCQMIQKMGCNSQHCLFFITKHIKGAEKFLEAQARVKQEPSQQSFDFITDDRSKSIYDLAEKNKPYTNNMLFELGIEHGIQGTDLKKEILLLEKEHPTLIEVSEVPGQKRNRQGLYLNYNDWDKPPRIYITFREKQQSELL